MPQQSPVSVQTTAASPGGGSAGTMYINPAYTERHMLLWVHVKATGATIATFTFAGQTPTLVGSVTGTDCKMFLYELLNPPTGTQNWSISLSVSTDYVLAWELWDYVDQTTPTSGFSTATGNSASSSVSVTGAISRDVVQDGVTTWKQNTLTPGGGQTQRWNLISGSGGGPTANITAAGSTKTGTGTVTLTWTISASTAWVAGAVKVHRTILFAQAAATGLGADTARGAEIYAARASATGLSSDYGRVPAILSCVGSATGLSSATGFPFFRILPVTLEVEQPQAQGFELREHEVQFQYQVLTGNAVGSPPQDTTGWTAALKIPGQPDRVLTNTDAANGIWRYFTVAGEFAPGIYPAVVRFTLPDGTMFDSPPFLVRPYG